jgi:hypothetical protein
MQLLLEDDPVDLAVPDVALYETYLKHTEPLSSTSSCPTM